MLNCSATLRRGEGDGTAWQSDEVGEYLVRAFIILLGIWDEQVLPLFIEDLYSVMAPVPVIIQNRTGQAPCLSTIQIGIGHQDGSARRID